jgi:glutathionylspermidine synthase
LLKILCELFPDSPYLLKADFAPLPNLPQVRKKIFGREGANAAVLDTTGHVVAQTDGPYAENKDIYQQLAEFAQDGRGHNYQAGVFYAWEACALGFRRGGVILDDMSKFVGHIVV